MKKKTPTFFCDHPLSFLVAKPVAREEKLSGWAMLVIVQYLQKYEIHAEILNSILKAGKSLLTVSSPSEILWLSTRASRCESSCLTWFSSLWGSATSRKVHFLTKLDWSEAAMKLPSYDN